MRARDRRGGRPKSCGRRGQVLFFALAWAWGVPALTPAAAPSPAGALSEARRLEAAIEGISGLVADFTQTLESPALPSPQVERGTVYLLRPGRMRWQYTVPAGKLAIASGGRTLLYLPEERQLVRSRLGSGDQEAGMQLLLKERVDLTSEFEIDWGAATGGGRGRPLRLTPRAADAPYRHLLVEIGPDGMLTSLAVVDALGSTVTYRFSGLRRVTGLDEGLFRFTPPAGVEIQDVAP
jgi:outer membrane lipoprotein carrier protein